MVSSLSQAPEKRRIESIDIVRGVIMLIMALDHTRDFFHNGGLAGNPTNLATTTPILFFTRWITHYCAPNFVFLSGISAYLAGTRRSKNELSSFLIKRGFWLMLVDIVVMSLGFSLNPLYNVIFLEVLWAIGFSMIILGLLVRLPLKIIAVIGALIFFGHDLLDSIQFPASGPGFVLGSLFFTAFGTVMQIGKTHFILDLYAVIPWTGVMLLGYAFGSIYARTFDAARRKKILLYTGIAATALFIILRLINHYGDPAPWSAQRNGVYTVLSFLNVSKYPPSLLYLLMTIGPSLIVLSLIENICNKAASLFTIYGSVPFFYFVVHFYLLRIITVIVFFIQGFTAHQIVTPKQPFLFQPPGFGFNLFGVYLIWLLVITVMYFPTRRFSRYKKKHSHWWLSYV